MIENRDWNETPWGMVVVMLMIAAVAMGLPWFLWITRAALENVML